MVWQFYGPPRARSGRKFGFSLRRLTASAHPDYMRAQSLATATGIGGACIGLFVGRTFARPAVPEQPPRPPAEESACAIAEKSFCRFGLPSDEHVVVKQVYASSLNYRLRIPKYGRLFIGLVS